MRISRAIVLILAVCETLDWTAKAGDVFPGFSARIWQVEEGLPHNVVQAITQTRDGYLWVGTREGLAKFDGVHFTSVDFGTGIAAPSITSLCESRDGSLWIATDGNGLFRFSHGKMSHYGHAKGLPNEAVSRVLSDGHDGVWIATGAGLAHWQDGQIHIIDAPGLTKNLLLSLCMDADGGLWVGSTRRIQRLLGEEVSTYRTANGVPLRGVAGLFYDSDGGLWIGQSGGLVCMKDKAFVSYPKGEGPSGIVSDVLRDRAGNLWIGTLGGLSRFEGGKFVNERRDDGASYAIYAIFEDREDDLWIGSEEGLIRMTPKHFITYTQQQGLSQNAIASLCPSQDGGLWIGTWGGGLNKLLRGKITAIRQPDGLSSDFVMAVYEGSDRGVWVGTDYAQGLNRLRDGRITQYTTNDGLFAFAITSIVEDRNKNIWIGSRDGLDRLHDGHFARFTTADGLSHNRINVLCDGRDGSLWIGTQNGLTLWKNNKFSRCDAELLNAPILSLWQSGSGVLWVGTRGEGLGRLVDGRLVLLAKRQGLASDSIYSIVEDNFQNLWFNSDKGIFRVSAAELTAVAEGRAATFACTVYGKSDGLVADSQYQESAQPSACKTADGRLWFQTIQGVAAIDPSRITVNSLPPPVVIEEILSDKKPLAILDGVSSLEIPPGRGELEIHYTGLSLQAAEKNRFRYKLDGVDPDWVDAGARRVAHYNNLPPGLYAFHVVACNDDGVWNNAGATVQFRLYPHVWQTWWFIALCVVGAAIAIGGSVLYVTRRRMQIKFERLEQQHAIERERARIARDMHDELGAKLTRISFQGAVAARSLSNPAQAEREIGKMTETARALVTSLDEIVWAVDPDNDSLENLAGYICRYAGEFFENSPMSCEFVIPTKLPDCRLSSDVRHHVFLAVKESLNNVLKHSGASRVQLRMSAESDRFAIVIHDDGRGIDNNNNGAGKRAGHGLVNICQRLASINGQCQIQSNPGKGTQIEFVIRLYD
ncbi:MAG TPA: two-component regulator propeller domain-containing protein [Verrucomicrobiae bacterium]|nr:two-component regulator propeller domain-containing protein [Verrucomicrobiae bacterium]